VTQNTALCSCLSSGWTITAGRLLVIKRENSATCLVQGTFAYTL